MILTKIWAQEYNSSTIEHINYVKKLLDTKFDPNVRKNTTFGVSVAVTQMVT